MPLVQGHSPASVSANTRAERHAGRPERQAVAIAERVADETRTHADDGPAGTCSIKGLVAFGPGTHKGELYSVERSARVPENFKLLPGTVPAAKLGHDVQQRFARSLGFPNVGTVTRCGAVPGYPGVWEVDVSNVPAEVGAQWNAGFLKSASVELSPEVRHPDDPAKKVGPVLTGISLLGEEQPAVRNFPPELRRRATSAGARAAYADGSEVPPAASPGRWLDAMADVTRAMAQEFAAEFDAARNVLRLRDREFTAATVCFSDFQPEAAMDPELEAKLKAAGLTPEQVAAVLPLLRQPPAPGAVPPPAPDADHDQMADDAPAPTEDMAAACRRYAEDPAATPEQKMMAAMFAEMGELKKRYSEVAAAQEETQKKDDAAKMAAFSDRVEQALKPVYRKVAPVVVEKVHKPTLMGVLTNKTFADEAERVRTFNDYVAALHALPDDPRLSQSAAGAETNARPGLTPLQRSMLESESARRYAPRVRDRLLGAAS